MIYHLCTYQLQQPVQMKIMVPFPVDGCYICHVSLRLLLYLNVVLIHHIYVCIRKFFTNYYIFKMPCNLMGNLMRSLLCWSDSC